MIASITEEFGALGQFYCIPWEFESCFVIDNSMTRITCEFERLKALAKHISIAGITPEFEFFVILCPKSLRSLKPF